MLPDRAEKKLCDFGPRAAGFPRGLPRWATLLEIWNLRRVLICRPSVKARYQQRAAKKCGPEPAVCMGPPGIVACRRQLLAPAPGHRLAVAAVASLFSSAFGGLSWCRQTQSFRNWSAHFGEYHPANPGCDQKRGDRIISRLLCQQGQDIIPQSTRIDAQQIRHHRRRRDVI